jgi:drug/metabolite transporter (DMT)-like permease
MITTRSCRMWLFATFAHNHLDRGRPLPTADLPSYASGEPPIWDLATAYPPGMAIRAERVALGSFLATAVLAGGNAVGIRFSNRELAPLWGAALRFSLAALVLLALMAALRLAPPRGRALAGAALFGALNFAAAFALAYVALVRLHAGFGQVLLSLVPLAALLLAVAWRQERLTGAAVAGTLLALTGVAVLSWEALTGPVPLLYLVAAVGSALCLAQAAVLVRGLPPVHPVTMNAVGMTVGAALLLAGSALSGDSWILPRRAETRTALAYLVLAGSVGVFLLYLVVLHRWSASRASYVMVLIPFVTVLLSAWLDDEPLGAGLLLGGPLILAGVYVGALRRARTRAPSRQVDV